MVQAGFSDHHEIRNMNIQVFSPGSDELYQEGKTDVHGKFGFGPDRTGTWKVIADDGMGHRKTLEITVSDSFFSGKEEASPEEIIPEQGIHEETMSDHHHEFQFAGVPLLYRIIFGFAIILGLTGILFGFMSKKRNR